MKLIAERNPVDVACIPIGGHYTMDRHDAVVAAEFVGAGTVIPMHYNTFPPIETDAEAFKSDVESKTTSKVAVLAPGEPLSRAEPSVRLRPARGTRRRGPSSHAPSARRRRGPRRSHGSRWVQPACASWASAGAWRVRPR